MSPPRDVLNRPGLHCKVAGPVLDGEGQQVRDRHGRPVLSVELQVALDGEHLEDCTAVAIGADGLTGVVRRWTRDARGKFVTRNDPPFRIASHTERGQVEVWSRA